MLIYLVFVIGVPHSCCHRSLQLCCRKAVCNHTVGLLYQVAHYVMLNLSVVSPGVSKTAQPQYSCGIRPDNVETLQMRPVCSPSPHQKRKSVLREEGVRSTLFRAIPNILKDVYFARDFVHFLAPYDNLHDVQLLGILPGEYEDVDLVDSVYGPVPKRSMLSYQQRRPLM